MYAWNYLGLTDLKSCLLLTFTLHVFFCHDLSTLNCKLPPRTVFLLAFKKRKCLLKTKHLYFDFSDMFCSAKWLFLRFVYWLMKNERHPSLCFGKNSGRGMTDEFPAFPKTLCAPFLAVSWQKATRNKRNMADIDSCHFYKKFVIPNLHFPWLTCHVHVLRHCLQSQNVTYLYPITIAIFVTVDLTKTCGSVSTNFFFLPQKRFLWEMQRYYLAFPTFSAIAFFLWFFFPPPHTSLLHQTFLEAELN